MSNGALGILQGLVSKCYGESLYKYIECILLHGKLCAYLAEAVRQLIHCYGPQKLGQEILKKKDARLTMRYFLTRLYFVGESKRWHGHPKRNMALSSSCVVTVP
jgi:hypothetical protein